MTQVGRGDFLNFVFFIIVSCFLWSTDLVLREPLQGQIKTFDLLVYEYGFAILFLTPWILSSSFKQFKLFKKQHLYGFLFIGLLGSSVGSFFLTKSLFQVGLESYSFFQFIQPLFVAILASKFLAEKFDSKNFIWFAFIMISGLLMNFSDIRSGVFLENIVNNPMSILASIVATLIWGSCTVVGKQLLKTYSPLFLAFIRWGVAFVAACVLFIWNGPPEVQMLTQKTSVTILFLSLVSGFFAMVLYYKGLKHLKATSVAYLELLYPVFSFGMGAIVLYQDSDIFQIIGLTSLIIAVVIKVLISEKDFFAKLKKTKLYRS